MNNTKQCDFVFIFSFL